MGARSRPVGWAFSVFGALMLAVGVMGTGPGLAAQNPGGNNGFVKVDGSDFDDGKPDNNPHPGCEFVIEFYNYDEGDLTADVTFEFQPPTTRPGQDQVILSDVVPIGEDPAGGGDDLDARRTYELDVSGVDPHPQQGHHVKLTIRADGSRGNDVKHKTFWVDCAPPSSTTTTEPPTTTTSTEPPPTTATEPPVTVTTEPPVTATTGPATPGTTAPETPATPETPAAPETEVLGTTVTRQPELPGGETPQGVPPPGGTLPRTGAGGTLVGIGATALFAGVTLLRMRRPGAR